ncbi:MAG: hypothetical protein WCN98_02435 [Verrucomicrobiaceae bacterium]
MKLRKTERMILFRFLQSMVAVIALGAGAPAHAADAGPPPKPVTRKGKTDEALKKPAEKPDAKKEEEHAAQGLGSFGKVLPLGQKNLDVKIPSFKDGRPDSFVRAGAMTRLDDNRMDMEKTDIRLYGLNREADLRVQLPSAIYDMSTQVMTSEERSRISRADFQLEGDTLVFDTRSQQGKMTGHIHMIIYDADTLSKKPDAAATPANGKQPGTDRDAEKK